MSSLMRGFEYFCGANITIRVGNMLILECAGLSWAMEENKMPIYAYNQRHFATVANGNVLVQGAIAINYVHHNYFAATLKKALRGENVFADTTNITPSNPEEQAFLARQGLNPSTNSDADRAAREILKEQLWRLPEQSRTKSGLSTIPNPNDIVDSITIKASFGEVSDVNPVGKTGYIIEGVHFTGRSQQIEVSEDVILEVIPFIARDVRGLVPRKQSEIINEPNNQVMDRSGTLTENNDASEILAHQTRVTQSALRAGSPEYRFIQDTFFPKK